MTLIMIPANLVIQTLFRDMEFAAVAKLLVPVIIPFNLIKAGLNSIITFLVYKRISNIFHRLLKDTASTTPSPGGE